MTRFFVAVVASGLVGFSGLQPASAAGLPPILAAEFDSANTSNDIVYLGTSGSLYQLAFAAAGGTWKPLTGASQGPSVAAATRLEAHTNTIYGANEVHYLTMAGSTLHVEQLYGNNFYPQDLTVIGSGMAVAADTNLSGYIDSIAVTDNVFYLGTDKRVHLLTWSPAPGWTEDTSLDSVSLKPAATASGVSGHATGNSDEIFYVGTNHHVYEVWRWSQSFDGWHPTDVTTANGDKPLAAGSSPITGFYDAISQNDAMFYLGSNHHVYELLFTAPAVWQSVDVTAGSGAPPPASGSALTAHANTISGSEEIFFLDASNNVQILWSWSSPQKFDGWHSYNVSTSAAGAPVPAIGSPLSTDINANDNTDDVYYLAPDKNVHELTFNETTGVWSAKDLNTQTSPIAPKAIP